MSQQATTSSHDAIAKGASVAIVVSRYNHSITGKLLAAARDRCERAGARVHVFPAPGSYELPALAHACASSGRYDGVIALGCLIRGETRHDRYIAEAVAHGLIGVTVQTGVPVAFGVLTVDHAKQAKARAGGTKGNKGGEAAAALLETILVKRSIAMGKTMSVGEELESKPDKARKKPRKKAATRRRA